MTEPACTGDIRNCGGFIQLVVVIEALHERDILRVIDEKRLAYTTFRGTGDGMWQMFFRTRPVGREKAIFLIVLPVRKEPEIMDALGKAGLNTPARGIAWSTPVNSVLAPGLEHCDVCQR